MRLTNKSTGGLKAPSGKADHIEWDDDIPGFGLRLRDGGSRVWVFQYKLGPKQRRITLGRAKALTADAARVRMGGDPAGDKAASIARATNTFGDLVRRYLEFARSELRPRSVYEIERYLERSCKPMHPMPVNSIDRRAIADRLNLIAAANGAVSANRARGALSAIFAWAIREGLAEINPVIGTHKRQEQSRDRVLSAGELRAIWEALEPDKYGAIIKLLILTGQRASEISDLQWSELDFERDMIALPGERTKNGRAHEIPMSPAVREILQTQPHWRLIYRARRFLSAKPEKDARASLWSPRRRDFARYTVAGGLQGLAELFGIAGGSERTHRGAVVDTLGAEIGTANECLAVTKLLGEPGLQDSAKPSHADIASPTHAPCAS